MSNVFDPLRRNVANKNMQAGEKMAVIKVKHEHCSDTLLMGKVTHACDQVMRVHSQSDNVLHLKRNRRRMYTVLFFSSCLKKEVTNDDSKA